MPKSLCKWRRDDVVRQLSELTQIVAEPKFMCQRCARAAKTEQYLCHPLALSTSVALPVPLALPAPIVLPASFEAKKVKVEKQKEKMKSKHSKDVAKDLEKWQKKQQKAEKKLEKSLVKYEKIQKKISEYVH